MKPKLKTLKQRYIDMLTEEAEKFEKSADKMDTIMNGNSKGAEALRKAAKSRRKSIKKLT
jgi:hypothetical protein